MGPPEHQRKAPSPWQRVRGWKGIKALPQVDRYGKAKKGALDVAEFIEAHVESREAASAAVRVQGLPRLPAPLLHHRQSEVAWRQLLHEASALPSVRDQTGLKALKAYLDKVGEVIQVEKRLWYAFLVTLTVRNGDDLAERFRHLHSGSENCGCANRGRGSVLDGVVGAVWSYEVKRGQNSGDWHPHCT
jgi:hypothetical protein